MRDKAHDISVALARWAKRTDIAVVAKRATKAANHQAYICTTPNGDLGANVHTEWLVGCSLT